MISFLKTKKPSEMQIELEQLRQDIRECEEMMKRNHALFDLTVDESLIEARIYEMNSLNKHHQYLVRLLREKQGQTKTLPEVENITV